MEIRPDGKTDYNDDDFAAFDEAAKRFRAVLHGFSSSLRAELVEVCDQGCSVFHRTAQINRIARATGLTEQEAREICFSCGTVNRLLLQAGLY